MPSTMKEYSLKINKIREYLGGCCKKCGSKEDLHIDHVDHSVKSFTVSTYWARSWEFLEPELKKCQLLCAPCHLAESILEGSLAKGWTNEPRQVHGTVWSYSKYKCRCPECKAAKSEYRKKSMSESKVSRGSH